ncbi:glycosyl hydrolase family 18 protein [Chitinophaga sp. MM2321]|uniref:glycosyl hydrolase family 18 protein n=1 Tax=Chitinophaga sp. MM2321 TaxID=3137178 RepID=UPI0032D59A11
MFVTKADILMLNEALTKRENQQFDSLVAMLQTIAANHAATHANDTTDAGDGSTVQEPDKSISGADINALADKMIPILQQKSEDVAAAEKKEEHLKMIRSMYGRPVGQTDTLALNDSIGVRYLLKLTQKINVTGIQTYLMEQDYTGYNYNTLSTFSFLGYMVDGNTGSIGAAFPEDQVKSIKEARAAGCNLQLIFFDKKTSNIQALLKKPAAQRAFADSLARLLRQQLADGVTIYFQHLPANQRSAFTSFIRILSETLQQADKKYKVNVVVPAYDKYLNYDLRALNAYVTFFLIDFTQATGNIAGALAPLDSDPLQSVSGAVSRYLQGDVPPGKISLLLSYYGAVWKKGKEGAPDVFSRYVSYSDIRKQYPSDTIPLFDEDAAAFFIEVKDKYGAVNEEIWFDNALSLGLKYDFLLKNELGGVAIWTLGADKGYTDLSDALVDKFVVTDTVFLDTVLLRPYIPKEMTFLQKVMRELRVYAILFRDPCSVDASQYEGDTYFIYIALFFLLLFIITGIVYYSFVRREGEIWKWREKVLVLLVAEILLVVVSTFMVFFLNKQIPFVGLSNVQGHCHSIPLTSVLIILASGFVLGLLIMRFLLQPLLKNKEVP